jgi:hypothetical protein
MSKLSRTLLALMFCVAPALAEQENVDWTDNYQQAIAEARRTNKPIFLEFRCEA